MFNKKKKTTEIQEEDFFSKLIVLSLGTMIVFGILSLFVPFLGGIALIAVCVLGGSIFAKMVKTLFPSKKSNDMSNDYSNQNK